MSPNFAFYIHHHGSGHVMRALSIASHLKHAHIAFLGSGLRQFQHLIPDYIECIHLPEDVAGPEDAFASMAKLDFLHYVPLNVEKVASRAAGITAALHALFPVILIVDVSAEVTLLATLCGISTVVVRQNGDRDDAAHLHAYQCAQLLIAPSPEQLMNSSAYTWVNEKTFFSGGFSKYSGRKLAERKSDFRAIAVMVGSGGTSIDAGVVQVIASQCPDRTVHVIGNVSVEKSLEPVANVVFHGQLDDPAEVLLQCGVIVGNAGHNTVMEMADLGKKFVSIPEDRPFQEQVRKAELLAKNDMAIIVYPNALQDADWKSILQKAENLPVNCWEGVINPSALADTAQRLDALWESNFPGLSF